MSEIKSQTSEKNKEIIIEIKELYLTLRDKVIFNRVSLLIEKGSFLPVIGPNGSGKSTLFKVILRLISPTTGDIKIYSHKNIGYVSQESPIKDFFPVSVSEIIAMGFFNKSCLFSRLSKKDLIKIEKALNLFNLNNYKDYFFNELSGGLKKRVLLARSYVSDADIFILDEPFSELDQQSSKELMNILMDLNRIYGKTIIFSYHLQDSDSYFVTTEMKYCLVKDGDIKIIN